MLNIERKDLAKLVMLCGSSYVIHTALTLLEPILPLETKSKGIETEWTGVIFGIFDVVRLVTTPFSGYIITNLGPWSILTFGLFLEGAMQILFGFSEYIPNKDFFVGYCLIIRGATGFGNVLSQASILTIAVDEFDTDVAVSYVLLCNSLGMLTSPYFGGVLYKYFGFQMPFTVSAIPMLLCSLNIAAYKSCDRTKFSKKKNAESSLFLKIVLLPDIFIRAIGMGMVSFTQMFLMVTLADHLLVLTNNTINADAIGLVFLSYSLGTCIGAPLVEIVHRRLLSTRATFFSGMFLCSILLTLIGPCPAFTPIFTGNVLSLHISLSFFGFFYTFAKISSIYDMRNCARENGLPDCVAVNSEISTIFMLSVVLGRILGACISPDIVERLNFQWASTALGIFTAVIAVVVSIASKILQRKRNVVGQQIWY